jgi:histidinol-phosphate aminotransferase
VLVRVRDANGLFDGLKARRILVKNLDGWHPLLSNCLRITIGTPKENDSLLAALRELNR